MMLGSKTFALTVTRKNPFQIGYADRIFAFHSKFSYGQRSKCADLLNSYYFPSNIFPTSSIDSGSRITFIAQGGTSASV